MNSISVALSVLPEERGLIFRTAFGTVPGVRKGTVEGTTGVRTKTCVKGCSNLDDSFPFSFFLFMERIRCLLVSFTLEKKMNRHYLLSTNIERWINFHERPYFTIILYHIMLYYNIACEQFVVRHSWQITPSSYLLLQKAANKALMPRRFWAANDDRSVHLLASNH